MSERTVSLDRYTQALRGHLSGQTPVDNVLNDFESVNFIQSENVRCMSRYQNPSMVNLRVNLSRSWPYNLATTIKVRIMYIMLNEVSGRVTQP